MSFRFRTLKPVIHVATDADGAAGYHVLCGSSPRARQLRGDPASTQDNIRRLGTAGLKLAAPLCPACADLMNPVILLCYTDIGD